MINRVLPWVPSTQGTIVQTFKRGVKIMKLEDVLNILFEFNDVDPKEVYINGTQLWLIDTTSSEYINLLSVPVYHYFNNGEGTYLIDTMWE